MGLLVWGISESFHCFGSNRELFLLRIIIHALLAGVLGVKASEAISSLCRDCVKVGKGSSYKFLCPPLPCLCFSQRVDRFGDGRILEKAKEGMENHAV